MFELPEAKRIRRDEIVSPSPSNRSSPEVIPADNEEAHARLAQLLSFDIPTDTNQNKQPVEPHTQQQKDGRNEEEEEEFEFRLFSAPRPPLSSTAVNPASDHKEGGDEIKTQKLKIRLRSPTPADIQPGDGRFIVPFRGWRYYFTKPELMHISARSDQERAQIEEKESARRRQYEDTAITGAQVLDWAKNMETPGCHLPWRVFRLDRKYHRVPKSLFCETENRTIKPAAIGERDEKKKKSKPGKKRRIILRTRAAAKAAEKAKAEATSNMTEAEKRNKKNRERKIKRRQKEREKKAAMAAAAGTATTTDGVGAASVDSDLSN